jgi:hypothetical protein
MITGPESEACMGGKGIALAPLRDRPA